MDIILSGLSASGKTTVANFLQNKPISFDIDNDSKERLNQIGVFVKMITCTTRKPRVGEKDKIDYYFLSKNNFEEKVKNNDFIEHSIVFGNLYGLTKEELNKFSNYNRILVLDPQGIEKIKKIKKDIIVIYFDIPIKTSLQRMKSVRKDDQFEIEKRMKEHDYFLQIKDKCDFIINGNEDINIVIKNVLNIFEDILKKNLK